MKTIVFLLLATSPTCLIAQNKSLEHTWYVEHSANNSGKSIITLVLDSVSWKAGNNTCYEVYNFKKDSTFMNRMTCVPLNPGTYELGAATYGVGTWYFPSTSQLVLLSVVNKKTMKREFTLQWISDRKIILTEK